MGSESKFDQYVRKYLLTEGVSCGRHCSRPVRFVPIHEGDGSIVGAYVCPENYVSRVVYYSVNPKPDWFENLLREQAGNSRVRSRDIRYATRHGWELGGNAESEIGEATGGAGTIKEYYWTFYPRSDEDKKEGTFLCEDCGRLFTQPLSSPSRQCPNCRVS